VNEHRRHLADQEKKLSFKRERRERPACLILRAESVDFAFESERRAKPQEKGEQKAAMEKKDLWRRQKKKNSDCDEE